MENHPDKHIAICHECDLAVNIQPLQEGQKAACPRCGYVITRAHKNAIDRMLMFSVTAMICLMLSNLFGFIKLGVGGQEREISLLETAQALVSLDEWSLSVFVLTVIIGIPIAFTLVLGVLVFSIKRQVAPRTAISLLRVVEMLRFWNMAEIFFLGILISMVKVASLADISLGISFWTYALFSLLLIAAILHVDKFQLSLMIKRSMRQNDCSFANMGDNHKALASTLSCHHCATIQPDSSSHCSFCNSTLHKRKPESLQRTWIYLITALVMYIPANVLPIMNTLRLGDETPNTIVGGVVLLWESGSYPIALIIFIASVVVPIVKFLIMIGLCLSQQFKFFDKPKNKMKMYRLTEFIGRWSMIDVFVVAFLASLIQLGNLMSIYPGPAVLAFAGMVIATMLAAASFDPRVFWENRDDQDESTGYERLL